MFTAILFEPARVWLRRGALDRRIARGADTHAEPAARPARPAAHLTGAAVALAVGLRNLSTPAEDPPRVQRRRPVQRREILREQVFLLQLAVDLESDDEIHPRGVALIEDLLTNGDSPVYAPVPEGTLRSALTHAHAALYLT